MTAIANLDFEKFPYIFNIGQVPFNWFSNKIHKTGSASREAQFTSTSSQPQNTPFVQLDPSFGDLYNMIWRYPSDMDSFVRLQQDLLPEPLPAMAEADIALRYMPAMNVSGDYYDFLPLGKDQMGLVIGDACGKGLKAGFLMASLCVTLRTHVQTNPLSAGELLACLNKAFCQNSFEDRFMTLTYGIWDPKTYTFTYSRAGHPPALHYQAATGCIHELDAGGMIFGVYEGIEYPTESITLKSGDVIVLYTDGITEVCNASDEMFGIDRLKKVVAAYGEKSPEELAAEIMKSASQFSCKGWTDDVTLIVFKRIKSIF